MTSMHVEGARRNSRLVGAPHAEFLLISSVGDKVRVAADLGMYAQAFMLSCVAHGLASVLQTMPGFFADTVREALGIPSSLKPVFGISFGYPDRSSPASGYRIGRVAVEERVGFHC